MNPVDWWMWLASDCPGPVLAFIVASVSLIAAAALTGLWDAYLAHRTGAAREDARYQALRDELAVRQDDLEPAPIDWAAMEAELEAWPGDAS
jgi:hypothetical protein